MLEELEFLFSGLLLGFIAGISPGPLLALVFSETLRHGKTEGIKVAIAPLISDLPIVSFVLFILSNLIGHNLIIGIFSLLGACYLIYLGVENLKIKIKDLEVKLDRKDGLKRGVTVNLLSPRPYLFWLSIGGPIVFRSLGIGISATILFVVGFYSLLVGSKICIALIVEKSKSFIQSKYYVHIIQSLGIALMLFALVFVYEGLRLFGLL
jgi:threonine/homoserine/homoserine lactone efflux protein